MAIDDTVKELVVVSMLIGLVLVPLGLPFITTFNWTALGVGATSTTGIALLAIAPIIVATILLAILGKLKG